MLCLMQFPKRSINAMPLTDSHLSSTQGSSPHTRPVPELKQLQAVMSKFEFMKQSLNPKT